MIFSQAALTSSSVSVRSGERNSREYAKERLFPSIFFGTNISKRVIFVNVFGATLFMTFKISPLERDSGTTRAMSRFTAGKDGMGFKARWEPAFIKRGSRQNSATAIGVLHRNGWRRDCFTRPIRPATLRPILTMIDQPGSKATKSSSSKRGVGAWRERQRFSTIPFSQSIASSFETGERRCKGPRPKGPQKPRERRFSSPN